MRNPTMMLWYYLVMNEDRRPTVQVFLSYADKDADEAEDLWGRLVEHLRPSRSYRWELWAFRDQLRVGDDFDERIQAAIAAADLGVFAISNAFLNSRYIRDKELPHFLSPATSKRVAPVLLKPLPRDADLRGLTGRQIHGYHAPFWAGGRPHTRDAWASGLADELHRVARTYGLGR
jgi:hypothetical protein